MFVADVECLHQTVCQLVAMSVGPVSSSVDLSV